MATYGIGIDTGGTYTDAVVYDLETRKVLAKGKSPTTRRDLSKGIGRALDMLPVELLRQARLVALSTTLATNACVENKGGRARLVLMGTDQKTLEWIGADRKYGLNYDDVLCLDTRGALDGSTVEHPDWDAVLAEHDDFFRQAEALSVAELNAMNNGAVCELTARDVLRGRYNVPLVMASELVSDLNLMERGATALLNARLLPVVEQFMVAVARAMEARGLDALRMIVRSDGTLMNEDAARLRPVETILSGPAASVGGCRALADCAQCLVVDMGGTTTDISIVRNGAPEMSGGIRIGGWRTQVKGVFIDTFGLGGDTHLYIHDGQLTLGTRRVEPLCCAAARWPQVRQQLEKLVRQRRPHTRPLNELLYLVRRPENLQRYSSEERKLIETLEAGPQMIGGGVLDVYALSSERLEREGIVMRCGLTPTDVMHIRGDYDRFDAEAARLAARWFLQTLPQYEDTPEALEQFCDKVYDLVKRRLFENIARVFAEAAYPDVFKGGMDDQLRALIARKWERRGDAGADDFFDIRLDASAALIGIGAPTRIFLPDVAEALGARCIIPEHAEVANAIGAIVSGVEGQASAEIRPVRNTEGDSGYAVYTVDAQSFHEDYDEAVAAASEAVRRQAELDARRRGAVGELTTSVQVHANYAHARDESAILLRTLVTGQAIADAQVRRSLCRRGDGLTPAYAFPIEGKV